MITKQLSKIFSRNNMKKIIQDLFDKFWPNRVYLMRTGLAKGLYATGGFQFIPRFKKQPREDIFLKSHNLKNMIVFDIGTWIGLHTLFFAKSVQPTGKVFSFEPNPFTYKELLKNIGVNNFDNIQTFELAVGSNEYKDQLIFDSTHKSTGSLNKEIKTDLMQSNTVEKIEIEIVSLDYIISKEGIPLPDFIKIDIEGFEFDALMGMENLLKNKKPELFIEIHGATRTEKESNILKIVSLLKKHNYDIQLVETNEIITIENTVKAREGHIYCY